MHQAGEVIGSYRLVCLLGRGGVAEVWRAEHVTLGSTHAIKFLSVQTEALHARLMLEGRVQSMLAHPNVVAVSDLARDGERVGLVMELVEGPTLAGWIIEQHDPEQVEAIFRGVCQGVRAAHARGLVHRDLKPANVLMARQRQEWLPKVSDFGIARLLEQRLGTRTGSMLGTLRFMAPEQLRDASRVDERADVWALGCILYELASRRPLIEEVDVVALYDRLRSHEWTSLLAVTPGCPEHILRTVEGCLRFEAGERPSSIDEVLALLGGAGARASQTQRLGDLALDVRVGGSDDVQAWRAKRPDGTQVFVKLVAAKAAADSLRRIEREARLGTELVIAGLAPTRERRTESVADCEVVALVRDWIPGPTLEQDVRARRYSVDESLDFVDELLGVLERLHGQTPPIVHRDLHPSHLVRGPNGLVLIGLGRARDSLPDPDLGGNTFVGTFGWQAPEQYAGDATAAADVYSAGVVAVHLLSRRDPAGMLDARAKLRWEAAVNIEPMVASVLVRLLETEPSDRPTASEARVLLAVARSRPLPRAASVPVAQPLVPRRAPIPSRRALLLAGLALASAGGIGALAYAYGDREPETTWRTANRNSHLYLFPTDACPMPERAALCDAALQLAAPPPDPLLRWTFDNESGPLQPVLDANVDRVATPWGQGVGFSRPHDGVAHAGPIPATYAPSFTASVWTRLEPKIHDDAVHLVDNGYGLPAFTGWGLFVGFDGYPEFELSSGGMLQHDRISAPDRLCEQRWTHLAVTWHDGLARMFVDGTPVVQKQMAFDRLLHGDTPFRVGMDACTGGRQLTGQLDEIALWDRAVSSDEVRQLYAYDFCRSSL